MSNQPCDFWATRIIESKSLAKFKLYFEIYYTIDYKGILIYPKRDYLDYFNFTSLSVTAKKISYINAKDYGKPLLCYFNGNSCHYQKIYKNIDRLIKGLSRLTSSKKLSTTVVSPPPYS